MAAPGCLSSPMMVEMFAEAVVVEARTRPARLTRTKTVAAGLPYSRRPSGCDSSDRCRRAARAGIRGRG
jgi:hypothetical protein